MGRKANPEQPRSVTLGMVAERAKVSIATVSLALRHHPRIPQDTRDRISRIAEDLGYRPDPLLTKVMSRLRAGRPAPFRSVIAGITTLPADSKRPYFDQVAASAQRRAKQLGYGFQLTRVPDLQQARRTLSRELHYRGIEGVVLLPLDVPAALDDFLQWQRFSVVAATYSVISPELHRVVPHQYDNMLHACAELRSLGYRRIGLVLPHSQDLTVHHGFTAAVLWSGRYGGTEPVEPLLYKGAVPAEVAEWYGRERPDVMMVGGENVCRFIAREIGVTVPGSVGFAVTNCHEALTFAGIDEVPADIGSTAIDLLHARIQVGEKGIPKVPTVTMINGAWNRGATVQKQGEPPRPVKKVRAQPGR